MPDSATQETGALFGLSVLIIDDDEYSQMILQNYLRKYNCNITSCSSGIEALSKIEVANKYDIIFMDCIMPRMNGFQCSEEIRKLENNEDMWGQSRGWSSWWGIFYGRLDSSLYAL